MRVVKNKIAPPFRNAEFEILHDRGINFEGDVLNLALEDEVVEKSGAFFSYKDQRLGQGKEKALQFLKDNPAVRDQIAAEVLVKRKPRILDDARLEAEAAAEEAEAAAALAALGEAPEPVPEKKKRGKAATE